MLSPQRVTELLAPMAPTILEIDARACEPVAIARTSLGGADLQPLQSALAALRRAPLVTDLRIAAAADNAWVLEDEHLASGKYVWRIGSELRLQLAKKAPVGGAPTGSHSGTEPMFSDAHVRRDGRSLVHLRPDFNRRGEPTLDVAYFERVGKKFSYRWAISVAHIAASTVTPMPTTSETPKVGFTIKRPADRAEEGT